MDGIVPGIATNDEVADDVFRDHLSVSPEPLQRFCTDWEAAFLNSKGFGSNNATPIVASQQIVAD